MKILENITLYFCEGASDKVYQACLNEEAAGCTVTFAYGRRGSTMKDGNKTPAPVAYESAKKIYDKLVAEKMAKGYTPGVDGTPFSGSSSKESSGISCQLLNAIEKSDVMRLCHEPAFAAQEKIDGERRLLERKDGVVRGINRKGLYVAVTEPVMEAVSILLDGNFVLDGEIIGDKYFAFDLIENDSGDLLHLPYRERLELLQEWFESPTVQDAIVLVSTAYSTADKLALVESTKMKSGEGVVFKNLNAGYNAGRPNSGGNALKFKFYQTCSAIVSLVSEGKRSVGLSLYDNGKIVSIGNVTIPPNQPIPPVNAVVEVRYLYAYPGGSLFQPLYLGMRLDIDATECVVTQLKLKQDAAA